MRTPLSLSLVLLILGLTRVASAALVLDGSQSAGPWRSGATSGLCGQFIQYKRQGTPPLPPRTRQEAVALLDKPENDPAVLGRIARRTALVNFRNGQSGVSEADFTGAMYPDEYLPFSQSPQASPQGSDVDLAVRLRGYFKLDQELLGKTLTLALNCDDHCSLRIGRTDVIPPFDTSVSQRRIRQVRFTDVGLYPIEIVYYQTGGAAFLEWAMSSAAETECDSSCTTPLTNAAAYGERFTPVPISRIQNSLLGENTNCQECGAPGQVCAAGTYCADGLCQACINPDHCGATCLKCPDSARLCSFGTCVECQGDDQCPSGKTCEGDRCVVPFCCDGTNGSCPNDLNCNPYSNTCTRFIVETFCSADAACPAGWFCHNRQCEKGPPQCTDDRDCLSSEFCDLPRKVCFLRSEVPDSQGGCTGQPGTSSESQCGRIEVPDPDGPVCRKGDSLIPTRTKRIEVPCDSGCRMNRATSTTRAAPVGLLGLCLFVLLARRSRSKRKACQRS